MDKEDPRQASDAESVTTEKIIKSSSLGDLTALKRVRPTVEDLIQVDYDHRTPLHLAAANGHLDVVRYIVDIVGEDGINPVDRWGGTPFDDAAREKHSGVVGYLSSFGGKPGFKIGIGVKHILHHIVDEGSEASDSDSDDDSNDSSDTKCGNQLPSWQLQAAVNRNNSQTFNEEDEVLKS